MTLDETVDKTLDDDLKKKQKKITPGMPSNVADYTSGKTSSVQSTQTPYDKIPEQGKKGKQTLGLENTKATPDSGIPESVAQNKYRNSTSIDDPTQTRGGAEQNLKQNVEDVKQTSFDVDKLEREYKNKISLPGADEPALYEEYYGSDGLIPNAQRKAINAEDTEKNSVAKQARDNIYNKDEKKDIYSQQGADTQAQNIEDTMNRIDRRDNDLSAIPNSRPGPSKNDKNIDKSSMKYMAEQQANAKNTDNITKTGGGEQQPVKKGTDWGKVWSGFKNYLGDELDGGGSRGYYLLDAISKGIGNIGRSGVGGQMENTAYNTAKGKTIGTNIENKGAAEKQRAVGDIENQQYGTKLNTQADIERAQTFKTIEQTSGVDLSKENLADVAKDPVKLKNLTQAMKLYESSKPLGLSGYSQLFGDNTGSWLYNLVHGDK